MSDVSDVSDAGGAREAADRPTPTDPVGALQRARLLTHLYGVPAVGLFLLGLFGFSYAMGFPDRVEAVATPILALVFLLVSAHAWRHRSPSLRLERIALIGTFATLVAAAFEPVVTGRFEIGYPYVLGYAPLAFAAAFLFFGPRAGTIASVAVYLGLAVATVSGVATGQIPAVRAMPLVAAQPILIGLLYAIAWSMATYVREHRVVATHAATDPLTGAWNRRAGEAFLESVEGPFALLVADLDDFKRINDAHGHAVGDEMLVGTVEAIRSALRPQDRIVRWGGDEFVAIVVGVDERDAEELAGRVRRAVERASTTVGESMSVSVGVAACGPGASWRDAFDRADGAMYAAKRDTARSGEAGAGAG
ncbi:MAG: GGDEF domain-containing protein [Trueperaceae bacterium]